MFQSERFPENRTDTSFIYFLFLKILNEDLSQRFPLTLFTFPNAISRGF